MYNNPIHVIDHEVIGIHQHILVPQPLYGVNGQFRYKITTLWHKLINMKLLKYLYEKLQLINKAITGISTMCLETEQLSSSPFGWGLGADEAEMTNEGTLTEHVPWTLL